MKIEWPAAYPGAHWFDGREDRAVLDALHQRALFRYYGLKKPKYVGELEKIAREFYGVKYALGVNSGTGALITAMTALRIGPGCEVILPAFFWVATVGAVVQAHASRCCVKWTTVSPWTRKIWRAGSRHAPD